MLPSLATGAVRRWAGQATWQPPETSVLVRHRAISAPRWIVSNRRDPPAGYVLDFDLGTLQRHEQPGTARLLHHDGTFLLDDSAAPVPDDTEVLGHVEQAPFPMMDALELRRVRETGQLTLVAGPADPLGAITDPVQTLGFVEGFPIQPRRVVEKPLPPWNLTLLIRTSDHSNWRHSYDSAPFDNPADDPSALALGSLLTHPAPGFVALRRLPEGELSTGAEGDGPAGIAARTRHAPRWIVAPVTWSHRPHMWALRAAASRARHVAKATRAPAPRASAAVLGYLRATEAPGFSALYSARHPVLGDQYVTRSALEATDMGYAVDRVLGYIGDIGAARRAGPGEILWASRFGRERRYLEP
jgi:hypothetical protein